MNLDRLKGLTAGWRDTGSLGSCSVPQAPPAAGCPLRVKDQGYWALVVLVAAPSCLTSDKGLAPARQVGHRPPQSSGSACDNPVPRRPPLVNRPQICTREGPGSSAPDLRLPTAPALPKPEPCVDPAGRWRLQARKRPSPGPAMQRPDLGCPVSRVGGTTVHSISSRHRSWLTCPSVVLPHSS